MKKYIIDIDGTICKPTLDGDYSKSEPLYNRIKKINDLYNQGHIITYFTARGMGRNLDNPQKSIEEFYDLTKNQLEKWGAKFHKLILNLNNPLKDYHY